VDDHDGDALAFDWSVPQDWKVVSSSGPVLRVRAPDLYGSSGAVTLLVNDGRGSGPVAAQVEVSTIENSRPIIASLVASPPQTRPGGVINLAVLADDPNGDALEFTWTAPNGWTLVANGPSATLTAPNAWSATGVASVEVDDGFGLKVTGRIVVSTTANSAPVIASLSAAPTTVRRGGTLTASVSASDADGDALAYAWTVPAGWTGSSTGSSITLTAPDQAGESAVLEVTVSDGTDARKASVSIATAANQAPVIHTVSSGPNPLLRGQTATVLASASDADGDPLTYEWSVDSTAWTIAGTGAQVTITAPLAASAPRTATATVKVSDGSGGTSTGAIILTSRGVTLGGEVRWHQALSPLELEDAFTGRTVEVAKSGAFVFPTAFDVGQDVELRVKSHPAQQRCRLVGEDGQLSDVRYGRLGGTDIDSLRVHCVAALRSVRPPAAATTTSATWVPIPGLQAIKLHADTDTRALLTLFSGFMGYEGPFGGLGEAWL
ncbi:MAG: Ig-like domain-containing protein, partial [Myxococcales bacterium]